MDTFYGHGSGVGGRIGCTKQIGDRHEQDRAESFPSRLKTVAHGRVQPARRSICFREMLPEGVFNSVAVGL
jgi:hypothetical protein